MVKASIVNILRTARHPLKKKYPRTKISGQTKRRVADARAPHTRESGWNRSKKGGKDVIISGSRRSSKIALA